MWESRFTHVLQRFLGTNFSLNVGLFDDLRTYLPESTWSDTSLDARTKFDYSVEEHSCCILRIYFSGSERSTRLVNNQTCDTKKKSILSIETLHDSGNYFTTKCRSRNSYTGIVLDGWPVSVLSRFIYITNHVILHAKRWENMAAKVVQDEKSTKKVVVVGGGLVRISRSVLGVFWWQVEI